MAAPAFVGATHFNLRFAPIPSQARTLCPSRTASPLHHSATKHSPAKRPQPPTCRLNKDFATSAAAAITLSISCLPLRPPVIDAIAHPHHQHQQSVLIVNSTSSNRTSNPLAVVGVGKAAIHDYTPYGHLRSETHYADPYGTLSSMARSVDDEAHLDDEARREFSLAVRLVTAVLLGVMLGVERRATSLNLGVRSITLISLCACMLSLMATGGEMASLGVPLLAVAPWLAVVTAGALAGVSIYLAARMRQRRTRHMASMSWTVALGVAMGGACGAGLSLLTVACYLAAVAVMRGDHNRRSPERPHRRVHSSVVRSRNNEDVGMPKQMGRKLPLDPLISLRPGDNMDGFST